LAGVLMRQNEVQQARPLAMLVLDGCRTGVGCARARYVANTALADIYRFDGSTEQSLQAIRQAVRDATEGFGEKTTDTTEALTRLAFMLRNAGHLIEAAATMDRAVRQATAQTLRKVERLRMWRWMAWIELDLGRYDSALERLYALLPSTSDPDDRARLLRAVATARLFKGEPSAALDNIDTAIQLQGPEHNGADLLYAAQVRAQALVLLGRADEALAEIGRVSQGLLQIRRSPHSVEVMRAERVRAEILLRSGRLTEASQALQSLHDELLALPEARPLELAHTLDLLGCAQRELGLPKQAMESHDAAAKELKKNLPADHPFIMRNALYRLAAANDREKFVQVAARIKLALGPTSIWHQVIDTRTDPSACHMAPTAICTLVL
jgi:tetratricopeptide (TPR) repeat protein